jgi:hypothetical protein
MALFPLFKNEPAQPAAAKPALTALREHLAVASDLTRQIEALNARLQLVQRDIRNHKEAEARLAAARTALDVALANVRYKAGAPAIDGEEALPDLAESRVFVENLQAHVAPLEEPARIAHLVVPRLQADVATLSEKRAALKPATDQLLHAACVEEGVSHQAEYQQAMDTMRATAHQVFAAFTAADTIARARGYGTFFGSADYRDLHLPLPQHPAYQANALMPEAAQAAYNADLKAVSVEAEALIERLLNGEAGG